MRRIIVWTCAAMVAAVAPPFAGSAVVHSEPLGVARPTSDFNGDGFSDLAVGVPFETVDGLFAAGAVQILYGGPRGLTARGNQLWTQDSEGIADQSEEFEFFGFGLATGDLNGDGFADLAVGVLNEDLGGLLDVGAVHVLFGGDAGLTGRDSQYWTENSAGVADEEEEGDQFGGGLATADFDGDGFADLVISTRGEDIGGSEDAGAVHVLQGTGDGPTADGSQYWTQDTAGVLDTAESSDRFGVSVAGGDLDGDGYDDLALGVIGEDLGDIGDPDAVGDAGAAAVLYGSPGGLRAEGNQLWTQDSPGVRGVARDADLFGGVNVGDFNGDGYGDLVVDAFNETVGRVLSAGSVNVLYGSADGVSAAGNDYWHEWRRGVAGDPEAEDRLAPTSVGDFDGDGLDDLAISAQGADGTRGAVHVLVGTRAGLRPIGAYWTQDSPGILDEAEEGDFFGTSMASGDFGNGPQEDLAIGSREGFGDADRAGAVNVLYGSREWLTAAGNQLWSQASDRIPDRPESGDFFGFPLAAA